MLRNFIKHFSIKHVAAHTRHPSCLVNRLSSYSSRLHAGATPQILLWSCRNRYLASSSADTLSADTFATPYFYARIHCPKDVLDDFCESLLCFGANSSCINEQDNHDATTEEVCITCTFSESKDVGACISLAANSIGLDTLPSYLLERGDQFEWIKKTQDSFHPLKLVEGVWIVPEWQTTPDSYATNIILNPGLAFGTGQHPTTKLCLLQLYKVIKAGDCFLDYGTGSGILAIASLKFGAASSVAVDIDPVAIASACQNAALNNIPPEKLQLLLTPSDNYNTKSHSVNEALEHNSYCKDAVPEKNKYDVVIANILLNPLLELAESLVTYAKPGAIIALSGFLIEQIPQIMKRYSPFMANLTVTQIDDYACISGTKVKDADAE